MASPGVAGPRAVDFDPMSVRLLLLGLLVGLSACAPGEPPIPTVQHLDLRRENGASTLEALDREPALVRRFTLESAASAEQQLAPWRGVNVRFGDGGEGGGVLLRAADYDLARGVDRAFLRMDGPLDSAWFNRIELDFYGYSAGTATLLWGLPGGGSGRADARTRAHEWQTVVLSMAGNAAWSGELADLRLLPCAHGPQAFELREVRFLREDFRRGSQPSVELGGSEGDAGLLGPAEEKRRAWPTDPGVALFASGKVPNGGRLAVSISRAGASLAPDEEAHFAVDARAPGGEWSELVHESLPALEGRAAQPWRELSADLAAFADGEVELRFRGWLGAGPPQEPVLQRGELLWGAPVLFAPRERDERPNLILVTLDTLRADAVGAYGGGSATPYLDELAAGCLLFEDTWSACNSTLPSHTSMLTGMPVPTHGVLDNSSSLAPEVKTLAQVLREAGYTTAAAVSVEHLQPAWSGLGRGFDRFLEVRPGASVDGALTLAPVVSWLEELSGENERPVFLWVHLFDPHTPYGPPAGFLREFEAQLIASGGEVPPKTTTGPVIGQTTSTAAGGFLEGVDNPAYAAHLYAAGVAYTDALMRGFVRELDRSGLGARSALAVTADHGESLGEHDVWYGHQRLHPAVMAVPLLLRLPPDGDGERPHGRVPTRASTLDIAATFLDRAGLPPLTTFGADLAALAALPEREERRVWFVHASGAQAGCRDQDAHYWRNLVEYEQLGEERFEPAGKEGLFLLSSDPRAERDVSEEQPRLATRYRELLEAWLPSVAGGRQISADIDPQQAERLRALGYTGGE